MKHTCLSLSLLIVLSGAMVAMGQTRQKPVPKLTNDDIGESGTPLPSGAVAQTAAAPSSSHSLEPESGPSTISWQIDLVRARELAAYNKGVVVVDVYTDWCGWCKKMDKEIYSDSRVAALGAHDVFVKANAEDGSQGQEIARRFGVTGYPTTLIMDGDGNLLTSQAGFISSPEAFVKWVRGQERRQQ